MFKEFSGFGTKESDKVIKEAFRAVRGEIIKECEYSKGGGTKNEDLATFHKGWIAGMEYLTRKIIGTQEGL